MKNKLLLLTMGFALTIQIISAQVPSYVPSNGLAGWWSFSGNANDSSANANNGTVNGATLITDRFGNANSAYSFDGINNFIEIQNSNSLQFATNNQSVSFWIKISETPLPINPSVQAIIGKYKNLNGFLVHFAGDGSLFYSIKNSSTTLWGDCPILSSNYPLNNYFHVVYTNDNNLLKGYINGQLFTTTVLTPGINIGTTLESLLFGKELSNDNYFKGILDDIGIWNRALTEDEINNLYNANICYQNITVTDTLVINTGILSYNPVTYNSTVTIYPNPAKDHITIDCGNINNVTGYNIKIFNELGQEVFAGAMNTQQYSVPLKTWTGNGLYLVKIYDASNNVVNTKKIILQ